MRTSFAKHPTIELNDEYRPAKEYIISTLQSIGIVLFQKLKSETKRCIYAHTTFVTGGFMWPWYRHTYSMPSAPDVCANPADICYTTHVPAYTTSHIKQLYLKAGSIMRMTGDVKAILLSPPAEMAYRKTVEQHSQGSGQVQSSNHTTFKRHFGCFFTLSHRESVSNFTLLVRRSGRASNEQCREGRHWQSSKSPRLPQPHESPRSFDLQVSLSQAIVFA
ncbi:hypothetical protein V8C34DRAFT_271849 [Trichoderma compactum]